MICVVLQNCMGFVEGETGSCIETRVMCHFDGMEEVDIKFEEAIDIKDEVSITVERTIDTGAAEKPDGFKVTLFWQSCGVG